MNKVNYNSINVQGLLRKVGTLNDVIFRQNIALALCVFVFVWLSIQVYNSRRSVELVEEKIERFKAEAKEELAVVIAEREAFVHEKEWKGRLRQSDTKKVAYLNEEIKQLECYNQAINLLEIKLTYP